MKITKWKSIYREDIRINLDIGDEFLHGKYKNKRSVVAGFKKNAKGDDVIVTDTGKEVPILKIRLVK